MHKAWSSFIYQIRYVQTKRYSWIQVRIHKHAHTHTHKHTYVHTSTWIHALVSSPASPPVHNAWLELMYHICHVYTNKYTCMNIISHIHLHRYENDVIHLHICIYLHIYLCWKVYKDIHAPIFACVTPRANHMVKVDVAHAHGKRVLCVCVCVCVCMFVCVCVCECVRMCV